jgi:6-phosphofructokinase 2
LKPSLHELADLTARQVRTERDQEEAAQDLVEQGRCEIVVVSLPPGRSVGDMCKDASGLRQFRTVGAGDRMPAGIVLGRSRGMPLGEAVRFGSAAGAAPLLSSGTQLCRRNNVERLYANAKILQGA